MKKIGWCYDGVGRKKRNVRHHAAGGHFIFIKYCSIYLKIWCFMKVHASYIFTYRPMKYSNDLFSTPFGACYVFVFCIRSRKVFLHTSIFVVSHYSIIPSPQEKNNQEIDWQTFRILSHSAWVYHLCAKDMINLTNVEDYGEIEMNFSFGRLAERCGSCASYCLNTYSLSCYHGSCITTRTCFNSSALYY